MKKLLERIAGKRVAVIGDVMLDHYIWGDASRISPEAPVPVVAVDRDTYTAGGAANVALNVMSLGGQAEICGWAGDDEAGHRLQGVLSHAGVAFDSRFTRPTLPTIVKTRVVVRKQQLCRLDREARPHVYHLDTPEGLALVDEKVGQVNAVVLSDYAKGTISSALVNHVVETARKRGVLVALDPKPRRRLEFHGVDLMTPNRSESLELAGMPGDTLGEFPAEEVCRRIFEQYKPKHLVVTLGPDGMLLSERGCIVKRIPTYAREVFDVSGAGDTVISALVLALAAGATIEEAAHFANIAAGIVVGKFGTATATPQEILSYQAQ